MVDIKLDRLPSRRFVLELVSSNVDILSNFYFLY
jgi:hypothetical protein